MAQEASCTFCNIISGNEPATVIYEDEQVIVIQNVLNWVPIMLLIMPKKHMTQQELWSSPTMERIGVAAVEAGRERCPNGYRLLSNFGHDGMQSQRHGHLHLLGGMYLGPYA